MLLKYNNGNTLRNTINLIIQKVTNLQNTLIIYQLQLMFTLCGFNTEPCYNGINLSFYR